MTRFRALAFNIFMFGSGFVLSAYAYVLRWVAPRRLVGVARLWGRLVVAALRLICGVRIEVVGAEHLGAGGALIAAQHQSMLDIFIWLAVLERPVFVLKEELTRIPLFGPTLRPAGMIAVNRAGGAGSLRAMVAAARGQIAAGGQLVIFPEGTRVAPGERVALQPGIVALARALGVPVVPAATDTGRRWRRGFLDKFAGKARVEMFPALPPDMPRGALLAAIEHCFHGSG